MLAFLRGVSNGGSIIKVASLIIGLGIAAMLTGVYHKSPIYVAPYKGIPESLRLSDHCVDVDLEVKECSDSVRTAY